MPTDLVDGNGGALTKPQEPPSSPHSSEGSPSSLIVARGRSRVRRISSDADPFAEENLRKRYVSGCYTFFAIRYLNAAALPLLLLLFSRSGYHSIKSFDQTFHLEKRWKLVREMGSGAYGVVMSVRHPSSFSFFFFFLFAICFRSPPLFIFISNCR